MSARVRIDMVEFLSIDMLEVTFKHYQLGIDVHLTLTIKRHQVDQVSTTGLKFSNFIFVTELVIFGREVSTELNHISFAVVVAIIGQNIVIINKR